MLHNLFVMEGVELNRDTEIALHEMKAKYRLLGSNYMMIGDDLIYEYEKVVTENKYFNFEQFVKIRCLNLMFFSVFQGGFYKFFFQYVKGKGIPLATFFQSFINPDPNVTWPADYLAFVNDFKRNCVSELYDDLDTLGANVEKIYKVNNDVGEPVRLNPYYFSRLMYTERGWVNDVLTQIFVSLAPNPEAVDYSEVAKILAISERLIIDLRRIDPVGGAFTTDFDLNAWRDDKFHRPIHEFASKNNKVMLELNKSQERKLTSFAKANANLEDREYYFVAVKSIFPRSDLFYGMKSTLSASAELLPA